MKTNVANFMVKQKQPYEFKVAYAEARAWEFVRECWKRGLNYHVSVGGLDSITLLVFLNAIGIDIKGVSVSHLEDKSIQEVHKRLGVERVGFYRDKNSKPWTQRKILNRWGFPVLSKELASCISVLQNPTIRNKQTYARIISKDVGSQKWLDKFKDTKAPFKVSSKCCYFLKTKPMQLWATQHNSAPFLGLMASEGGVREYSLKQYGCNLFGVSVTRSAPFAIFHKQDLLRLALELNVEVPEVYGKIVETDTGELTTTECDRTGCNICGFGIHLESRPHRFDWLFKHNPKEWDFWMNKCVTDETGTYGWGRVLDYIGIKWNPPIKKMAGGDWADLIAVKFNELVDALDKVFASSLIVPRRPWTDRVVFLHADGDVKLLLRKDGDQENSLKIDAFEHFVPPDCVHERFFKTFDAAQYLKELSRKLAQT